MCWAWRICAGVISDCTCLRLSSQWARANPVLLPPCPPCALGILTSSVKPGRRNSGKFSGRELFFLRTSRTGRRLFAAGTIGVPRPVPYLRPLGEAARRPTSRELRRDPACARDWEREAEHRELASDPVLCLAVRDAGCGRGRDLDRVLAEHHPHPATAGHSPR